MSFLTILLSLSALFGADPEASPQDTTMSERASRTTLYGIALNSSDTDMGIGVLSNNMSSRTRLSSHGLLTNLKAGLPFCPAGTISK